LFLALAPVGETVMPGPLTPRRPGHAAA
jgi:hypothetical protein